MANNEKAIKEHYAKNLKAAGYVALQELVCKVFSDMHRIPLSLLYDVLRSGKFKGSRLLDLGSGAVVHFVALPSAFYPNIIMSDFVEDNCEELKRWLRGQSTLKQPLDVPAEVEGYGGDLEVGRRLLEDRIRKSVKQVVRCDVLNDDIFLEDVKPEVASPYDLIISSLCLESSAPDFDNFLLVLKRVNKLLRQGGGLFLVGFFEAQPWKVDDKEFHYLSITESELRKALEDCGFGNTDMRVHKFDAKDDHTGLNSAFANIDMGALEKMDYKYEHTGFYCLITEKL